MDIVEFVEEVMDIKLFDFQKKFLTEMYNIYKKDPASYYKIAYPCRRGSAKFDAMLLFTVIFSIFNKESEDVTNYKCKQCKKDWTKCSKCPVMMKWVKEHKSENGG